MSRFLSRQHRNQRAGLLVVIGLGSIMLWQTWLGSLLLYPFTILSTWFHEMGHGLAAMLVGARFEQLAIYPDGSGVAQYLRPVGSARLGDAFIALGGPMGPPLAGTGFILASRTARAARVALAVLAAALILSTLIWVRSLTGWVVLPPLGLLLLAIVWRSAPETQRFAIQVLGVQACISTWQQSGYLFSEGGMVGGFAQRSDTAVIGDTLFGPYWFWGMAISALILALLWWSLRRALRN